MSTALNQLDTTIQVVTPENIAFDYRVAGPFRRLPAFLLDLAIRIGAFILIVFIINFFTGAGGGGLAVAVILIGWFVSEWFYGGLFEAYWNGQTPGKRMMGLRVLTTDGQPINGLQAVMRNVFRTADMYPMLSLQILGDVPPAYIFPTFFVGLAVMACNRRFQRVGDLVCGTLVVIEEKPWLTEVAKVEDPRTAQLAELLPADFRVSRSMAQTLSSYAERRRYFTPARRREIAGHLGEPLLRRFGLPADTSYDLLLCALYYRTFISDRPEESPRREVPRHHDLAAESNASEGSDP
ncbi:MAG: RDD family protein [Planctomycetaceae bacterium]|nr:MAG: RDD family protein [Planctomycetaceae bacterium]